MRHQRIYAEGTRLWVLKDLEAWAAGNPEIGCFWIKGTGGMGKSVISGQCVKRYCEQTNDTLPLTAHFFCKYDSVERNDPRIAIATIAFRLASQVPELATVFDEMLQGKDGQENRT